MIEKDSKSDNRTIRFSYFEHVKSSNPHFREMAPDEFFEFLKNAPKERAKLEAEGQHFLDRKDGPGIASAEFDGQGREKHNIERVHLVILDVDEGLEIPEVDDFLAAFPNIEGYVFSTPHFAVRYCEQDCCVDERGVGEVKGGGARIKIVLPLRRAIEEPDVEPLVGALMADVDWDGKLDGCSTVPTQVQYLPREPHPQTTAEPLLRRLNPGGEWLDPDEYLTGEKALPDDVGRASTGRGDDGAVVYDLDLERATRQAKRESVIIHVRDENGDKWPKKGQVKIWLRELYSGAGYWRWLFVLFSLHHLGHHAPNWTPEEAKEWARHWSKYGFLPKDERPAPGDPDWHYDEASFESTWKSISSTRDNPKTWKYLGWRVDQDRQLARFKGGNVDRCALEDEDFVFHTRTDVEFAKALAYELYADEGHLLYDDGSYYVFEPDEGIWVEVDEAELAGRIMRWDGEFPTGPADEDVETDDDQKPLKITHQKISGALKRLKSVAVKTDDIDGSGRVKRDVFGDAPKGLVCGGTFWTIRDDELVAKPVKPEDYQRFAVGVEIDPADGADTPMFDRFLADLFSPFGADQADEVAQFLVEWLGICLMGLSTKFPKALILVGEGKNGKSTFIDIVKSIFSDEARTAIAPQKFAEDKWVAELAGARLNAVNEMPKKAIMQAENLKAILSGDEVAGRRNYGHPFYFNPEAGHLFAANELPVVNDATLGFWRRMAVVPFNYRVPAHKRDKDLADKIIEAELGGVICKALLAAQRVLKRGGFEIPQPCYDRKAAWNNECDPVQQFVDECLDTDTGEWTSMKTIYGAYKHYCDEVGRKALSKSRLGRQLTRILGDEAKKHSNGTKYKVRLTQHFPPYLH